MLVLGQQTMFNHKLMKTLGIIPARYASSRFPGKPLVDLGGKTMIQRVYELACEAPALDQVVIATDDAKIASHAESFGATVIMTDPEHASGTDRCAEAARRFPDFEYVINIQGDEPFLEAEQIAAVARPLWENKAQIATLSTPVKAWEDLFNPNIVKVVLNHARLALYFSRSPIPYLRNQAAETWLEHAPYFRHIGLYGFQRQTLLDITQLDMGELESAESLEQLRWLEAGYSIFVNHTPYAIVGIDTPEDLEKARRYLTQLENTAAV